MKPSDFDGVVRCGQLKRPRDMAPGRVPIQWLDEDGTVDRENDLDARVIAAIAEVAVQEGYTLEQMLARAVAERLLGQGRVQEIIEDREGGE